jgi:hypothetical protein
VRHPSDSRSLLLCPRQELTIFFTFSLSHHCLLFLPFLLLLFSVTDPEPLPAGHPLFKLPNVILTPHMSGSSKTYFHKAVDVLKVNVERMGRGKGAVNGWYGKAEHA